MVFRRIQFSYFFGCSEGVLNCSQILYRHSQMCTRCVQMSDVCRSHRPRSEIKYHWKNECGEVLNFFLYNDHKTTLTFCQVIILLFATYQAHRLLTSGLKAHKVVHASLGSRFGQQDLYFPILIEILMIYFFQYGSFGGGVLLWWNILKKTPSFILAQLSINWQYQNLVFGD